MVYRIQALQSEPTLNQNDIANSGTKTIRDNEDVKNDSAIEILKYAIAINSNLEPEKLSSQAMHIASMWHIESWLNKVPIEELLAAVNLLSNSLYDRNYHYIFYKLENGSFYSNFMANKK